MSSDISNGFQFPAFRRIGRALHRLDNPHQPAEVHGLLCGIYCIQGEPGRDLWLKQVLSDSYAAQPLSPEAGRALQELFLATTYQFNDAELGFTLLLPDDEMDLTDRAESLGRWCDGFMAGLGLGGFDARRGVSDELREFLQDLLEISRVEFDTDTTDQQDEDAFAEIVEYVRMGVLLVSEELTQQREEGSGPGSARVH